MSALLTSILVLTFLGILAGLVFCIWIGYKIVKDLTKKESAIVDKHTCKYTPELDRSIWQISTGIYHTGCGKEFNDSTDTGQPITDWMTYCPYCGGKVE